MTAAAPDARGPLVLYDDAAARAFEPFATSRPAGELRAGALLGRERWSQWLDLPVAGVLSAPHLAGFAEAGAPPVATGDLAAGTCLALTRALPFLPPGGASAADRSGATRWRLHDRLAAVRLGRPVPARAFADGTLTLEALLQRGDVAAGDDAPMDGIWLEAPWDLVRHLDALLQRDLPSLATAWGCAVLDPAEAAARGVTLLGDAPVWLEPGAIVEPLTLFDTRPGPVLLRGGATVQAFTRVTGPCFVGRGSQLLGDRVSGSAIGDACRVRGELSASVLLGHSNKGHDGFIGHSVLGRWVNLGAGTITSNLKNTYGAVACWTPDGLRDTGLQFLGTLFGDHAKTGIGLRLTTGCVVGAGANVVDAMPPKAVAPFAWGTGAPYAVHALPQFLRTAERMMARRQVVLDDAGRRHLAAVHAHALADARWPRP